MPLIVLMYVALVRGSYVVVVVFVVTEPALTRATL